MLKAKSGRIVNITSCPARRPDGPGNYSSAKAGLIGLTKATARELACGHHRQRGRPRVRPHRLTKDLPEALWRSFVARTPLGRFGTAEEVAAAVAFALTKRPSSPGRSSPSTAAS
jgi:3-oxoacyl-[acyl-carrier protein] reductase